MVLLHNDGSVVYHDPQAALFFQRYVLPLLQYGDPTEPDLQAKLGKITVNSPVMIWNNLPGIILATVPCVQRRQLCRRASARRPTPEISTSPRKSSAFAAASDSTAPGFVNKPRNLVSYSEEDIQRQARLMLGTFKDQVRLGSLEGELNSISGHLANAYEELSLVYQISGGMRINRPAHDFFKQACLEVLEVMGVQGMGVALQR